MDIKKSKIIQSLIERTLETNMECRDAFEVKEQEAWNYLLVLKGWCAIGSIDYFPSNNKIKVNKYDGAITIGETYRQDLEEKLRNIIIKKF